MLIQFTCENFKTFKDKTTLSLVASNYDKLTNEDENVYNSEKFKLRLLKSAVVYGANASGKSKLFEALFFMRDFILNGFKENLQDDPIKVDPFRLNTESENSNSIFEIIFISNDILYRYGFELNTKKVCAEWLYYKPKTKEIELFYRDGNTYETHGRDFSKGKLVIKEGLVRDNTLLISVASKFNDSISDAIINWFKNLKIIYGLNDYSFKGFTLNQIDKTQYNSKILNFIKAADLGISGIKLQKSNSEDLEKVLLKELKDEILQKIKNEKFEFISDIITSHPKFDKNKSMIGSIDFSLEKDESKGTSQFFSISGPILDVLENGYILVVDELDAQLHTNLVCRIVALFNSKEFNPKNAQLIFNTHDTNLLSANLFRRDQIWFTEKNNFGEAKLYSLSDFKSKEVRKNDPLELNYLKGKYGAIPYLEFFEEFDFQIE